MEFLSTPSARRATLQTQLEEIQTEISIHALREEGDFANLGEQAILKKISIHALREEGDIGFKVTDDEVWEFLSTPSARRATRLQDGQTGPGADFYPRPPRGGRRLSPWIPLRRLARFLSTPSARRATNLHSLVRNLGVISIHALREEGDGHKPNTCTAWVISIHALREEGDVRRHSHRISIKNFYPRPPRGGRR